MIPGWIKGLSYSLLLLTGTVTFAQSAEQIVIVKSSDNAYFDQTIETLISHVDRAVRFRVMLASESGSRIERQDRGKLFIALGQDAVLALRSLPFRPHAINAYLTYEQYLNQDLGDQTTVLLDQPMRRYLAFCKLMLGVESVGIITQQELELDRRQLRQLGDLELVLNQYRVDRANKLLPVLRTLLRQNDSLLMLPRQSIYNRDSLKGVLLTSYRNRKPVISYSPAHVKSGALASIYSSPTDIGRHLARLVNENLLEVSSPKPAYQFARFYSITSNPRVARALGIKLPDLRSLRSRIDGLEP